MAAMTYGSLFSGIGGIDLGLDRAGMRCVWQVEKDPFCRRILDKHWPNVPKHDDVETFIPPRPGPALLAGGFPCQDISSAHTNGARRGLRGERSGLWTCFSSLVALCLPRWVLVENSPEWRRWVPEVRADLARLGYASLPLVLSAGAVGAPHSRPRGFVVAHANCEGESLRAFDEKVARLCTMAADVPWPHFSTNLGKDDGLPHRMDRLHALGNAACPQVIEVLGRAIMETNGLVPGGTEQ